MATIEHPIIVRLPAPMDTARPTAKDGYDAVRYNATTHGIRPRLVILPHKDAGEFGDLLATLIEEHRPAGLTEQHLVEDLAAIIWCKRRVLLAEGPKSTRR